MRFDDPTIEAVATELQTLANEPEMKRLVKNEMLTQVSLSNWPTPMRRC
jgi:hypothetical protein